MSEGFQAFRSAACWRCFSAWRARASRLRQKRISARAFCAESPQPLTLACEAEKRESTGESRMSSNILSSDVWGRDEIALACMHVDPSLPSVASVALCRPCPNGVAARSLSIDGPVRLVPFTPFTPRQSEARRSEGKGTGGPSLGVCGFTRLGRKSYSQAEKIVILIANPGIRTCRN